MSKKLKHPVITVSVTVRCRADNKREVLDSIANETPYAEDLARAGFVIETRANPRPAQ